MKKVLLTVLTVLLFGAAAFSKPKPSGFGDMNQKLVVTPKGGLVFPTGDFGDVNDLGFGAGAGLEYFVAPRLALGAFFDWYAFGDESATGTGAAADGASFFMVGAGARGFLFDDAKLNLYGKAAGGLYQGDNESNSGLNLGVGGLYRMNPNMGFFAEGGIHFVFDVGTGAASTTATFFGASAGLAITIPTGK